MHGTAMYAGADQATRRLRRIGSCWRGLVVTAILLATCTIAAGQQDTTIVLPGGVEMRLVWIEPGTFLMGGRVTPLPVHIAGADVPSRIIELNAYEWPPHEVTLTRGFYMGATEVTSAQWMAVMEYVPGSEHCGFAETPPDHAAWCVYWTEASEYMRRLNLIVGGHLEFNLPSEAQWEYAARGSAAADR